MVLLLFLPPLLYWEAITAPTDIMWANRKQIGMLAIGLVFATTFGVAAIAHAVIAHMTWATALVLGAIVAPTDELASAPVLERFRIPRHVIAIVGGESLVNDAVSLVLYAAAVTAVLRGSFDVRGIALYLVLGALGSIIVGVVAGRLAVEGWRRVKETNLQAVISLLLPFVAYVPAQRLGTSGVLEVVTAGVYVNRFTPIVLTPDARLRLIGFWETFVFVANALLFLLVGLQLHHIAARVLAHDSWSTVFWYALAVNVGVVFIRFAWIAGTELLRLGDSSSEHAEANWKHAIVASWSGLRGAVSLAAALAIPLTVTGGVPFPERDLIIFLTFTVILVTLVGGGLTLPVVIASLHMTEASSEEDEDMQRATTGMSAAAFERIDRLERERRLEPEHAQALRRRYEHVRERSQRSASGDENDDLDRALRAERDVIEAQRQALIAMRDRGEIDNAVLRDVQLELDLADRRTRG